MACIDIAKMCNNILINFQASWLRFLFYYTSCGQVLSTQQPIKFGDFVASYLDSWPITRWFFRSCLAQNELNDFDCLVENINAVKDTAGLKEVLSNTSKLKAIFDIHTIFDKDKVKSIIQMSVADLQAQNTTSHNNCSLIFLAIDVMNKFQQPPDDLSALSLVITKLYNSGLRSALNLNENFLLVIHLVNDAKLDKIQYIFCTLCNLNIDLNFFELKEVVEFINSYPTDYKSAYLVSIIIQLDTQGMLTTGNINRIKASARENPNPKLNTANNLIIRNNLYLTTAEAIGDISHVFQETSKGKARKRDAKSISVKFEKISSPMYLLTDKENQSPEQSPAAQIVATFF